MVKGKTVFSKWDRDLGMFFKDAQARDHYLEEKKRKQIRDEKHIAIQKEIDTIEVDVKKILAERGLVDKEMEQEISLKTRDMVAKIEDAQTQIAKLQFQVDLLNTAIRTTKTMVVENYKEKRTFPELKRLQNKQLRLVYKRQQI